MRPSVVGLLALSLLVSMAQVAFSARCDPNGSDAASIADARAAVGAACDCAAAATHGAYVRCAVGVLNGLPGGLRRECKGTVKKCYAKSTCGKPGVVTCYFSKGTVNSCKTQKDAGTCLAMGGATAGATSCCDVLSGCFVDTGDGTILDTCTGLQWEKKTGVADGIPNAGDLHEVDNGYTWAGLCALNNFSTGRCQPNAAAEAVCLAQAGGGTGCTVCAEGAGTCVGAGFDGKGNTTVWDWINQVNAANFAGHSDWRLPSEAGRNVSPRTDPRELETILNCGFGPPCIHPIFGVTASSFYWSASAAGTSEPAAWGVYFNSGNVDYGNKDAGGPSVRAVRGGP